MSFNIILGAQWGDEGKGRYTDLLAAQADVVGRYSGGDNAGHTVTVKDEVFPFIKSLGRNGDGNPEDSTYTHHMPCSNC